MYLPARSAQVTHSEVRMPLQRPVLVICSACRRVRDDVGQWHKVSLDLSHDLYMQLSHGLCPECMLKLYPEFALEGLE